MLVRAPASPAPMVCSWHENDMTGVPQLIDPHCDTWTGGPQRTFVCVRYR